MFVISCCLAFCGFTVDDKPVFVPIIMYHSVYEGNYNAYVISPQTLESDMEYIKQKNMTPVFVSELISHNECKSTLPENPIVITFDDGYYNNYCTVLPIMKKYNYKFCVSLVGSYIEEGQKQHPYYSYLNPQQIVEMQDSGLVEFLNHSNNMHNMQQRVGVKQCWNESDEDYEVALIKDSNTCSKKIFDITGKVPPAFTYPFGAYTTKANNTLLSCGYKAFLTCREKPNYISRNEDYLFLYRYNRSSWIGTYDFFNKALQK